MSQSTTDTECAICLDDINLAVNCVRTECGHCFHTSCLMKNVAHNGFGCPYCRTEMASIASDNCDSESEYSEERSTLEMVMFDDYALRGFRLFMNNVEGIQHAQEDIDVENLADDDVVVKPTPQFIAEKLAEQGITMEHLIKILLRDHDEYDDEDEEFERVDDDVWGKCRIIISNYQPEEPQQV